MVGDEVKEVNFYVYCPKCKYKKLDEALDPCNDCLSIGMREGTEKPEYYEEADAIDIHSRRRKTS